MDFLTELGMISFSARLRRLSDQITQDVVKMYKRDGISVDLRYTPILLLLESRGEMNMTEISSALGYTKSAISQTLTAMLDDHLILEQVNTTDRRKKTLQLTETGKALIVQLKPVWHKAEAVFHQLDEITGGALLSHLNALEQGIHQKSLLQRYLDL